MDKGIFQAREARRGSGLPGLIMPSLSMCYTGLNRSRFALNEEKVDFSALGSFSKPSPGVVGRANEADKIRSAFGRAS